MQHLITNEFQGKSSYVTKCQTCELDKSTDHPFYEFEIAVKEHESIQLEQAIEATLAAELLSGANQYFCEPCGKPSDALRFIRLERLPKVMNIQVNRFVFDMATLSKRKINTHVLIPDILDMTPFVKDQEVKKYALKAILMHQGADTNTGHYIACVRDHGRWFMCDDEVVTEMKKVDFDLYVGASKKSLPKVTKGY